MRYYVLDAEEHTLDVDRLHAVPLGLGQFMGGLVGAGDAGVVDQHVHGAEMRGGRVDRRVHRGLVGDVDVPVAGGKSAPQQFVCQCCTFAVEHVQQRHARAFLGQPQRAGTADAECGAGDDADLVLNPFHGSS